VRYNHHEFKTITITHTATIAITVTIAICVRNFSVSLSGNGGGEQARKKIHAQNLIELHGTKKESYFDTRFLSFDTVLGGGWAGLRLPNSAFPLAAENKTK